MECLLPYLCMVTVPHIMVGLERMMDYRGVGLARFYCIAINNMVVCVIGMFTVDGTGDLTVETIQGNR